MNEYPSAQDQTGQAPSPYPPQYPQSPPPQYPQYPQQPYGQQGYVGFPPQANAPSSRRSAAPLILGGVAAVVLVAVLALLALHAFGATSISGTWYGAGTTGSVGSNAETFKLETYLSLTQNGGNLSGSGELCSVGTSNIPFNVTGTLQGSTLEMTWTLAAAASGAASSDTERVTGHFTNDTVTLTSTDASGYYSSTLKHGSHDAFSSACNRVTV